jgi:hypothetical protein
MSRLLPDTIKIAVYDREAKAHVMEEVDAKIVGPLAFREDGKTWRGPKRPLQLYSITHVPSGLRVIDGLNLRNVRIAIKRLQAVDWANPCFAGDGTARLSDPAYLAAVETVARLRQELCV